MGVCAGAVPYRWAVEGGLLTQRGDSVRGGGGVISHWRAHLLLIGLVQKTAIDTWAVKPTLVVDAAVRHRGVDNEIDAPRVGTFRGGVS
jgi:hypothetical protein